MGSILKILRITNYSLNKLLLNKRLYAIMLLIWMLTHYYLSTAQELAQLTEYHLSGFTFVFLWDTTFYKFLVLLGILVLFCDAPFIDFNQKYLLIRTGKTNFMIGQSLYVIIGVLLYFVSIVIMSIVILAPNVFFANEWGKVITTLARNPGHGMPMLVTEAIVSNYTAIKAFIMTLCFAWGGGTIIGLLMLYVSMYARKIATIIGAIIIALPALFNINAIFYLPQKYIYLSPVSILSLETVDRVTREGYSISDIGGYTSIIISILIVVITLSAKNRDIYDTNKEKFYG